MKTNMTEAIARSSSHDEIVRVIVADKDAAKAAIAEAKAAAESDDLECAYTDTNNGWDVWATKEDSDKMEWRLEVVIGE